MKSAKTALKPTEKNVQDAISNYLAIKKIPHWRVNSGAMIKKGKDKNHFIKFLYWLYPHRDEGLKFLDLQGLMPDGRGLFVECKAPGEVPDTGQIKTLNFLCDCNAIALWADSIDMFVEKWEKIEGLYSREYWS